MSFLTELVLAVLTCLTSFPRGTPPTIDVPRHYFLPFPSVVSWCIVLVIFPHRPFPAPSPTSTKLPLIIIMIIMSPLLLAAPLSTSTRPRPQHPRRRRSAASRRASKPSLPFSGRTWSTQHAGQLQPPPPPPPPQPPLPRVGPLLLLLCAGPPAATAAASCCPSLATGLPTRRACTSLFFLSIFVTRTSSLTECFVLEYPY